MESIKTKRLKVGVERTFLFERAAKAHCYLKNTGSDRIEQVEAGGASIAAIGGAIYHASSPGNAVRQIREKLKSSRLV